MIHLIEQGSYGILQCVAVLHKMAVLLMMAVFLLGRQDVARRNTLGSQSSSFKRRSLLHRIDYSYENLYCHWSSSYCAHLQSLLPCVVAPKVSEAAPLILVLLWNFRNWS